MSSTCPDNMVNFGLLTAEIRWRVWGTPANFNGFRVLAALLHGISSSGRQPHFAALNRGRHLCSAWRPLRWALAHILVCSILYVIQCDIVAVNRTGILGHTEADAKRLVGRGRGVGLPETGLPRKEDFFARNGVFW